MRFIVHGGYFFSFSSANSRVHQEGKLSAEEVMQAHLDRIQIINPSINALIQRVDPEECLRASRRIDESIANNMPIGKMCGVPIAIKDTLRVKGLISSCGCRGFYKEKADHDATLVARLKREGAIVLGLTNVPEMCIGADSENSLYGRTNNPYDLSMTPGGSSGGSAALIAAGGAVFSIGSDGGGSIRWPAHCNGIAALKPTQRLLPTTGDVWGDALGILEQFIAFGPLARHVDDLILGLSILAGPDGHDPHTIPMPLKAALPLKQLRVAFFVDDGAYKPTKEVQDVVREAAYSLKSEVALVEERLPKCVGDAFLLHWPIFLGGDRGVSFKKELQSLALSEYAPEIKEFIRQSEQCCFSVEELYERLVAIDRFRVDMLSFMNQYDVILCPTAPKPAKPNGIGLKEIEEFSYMMAHNITGWPAAVVRCGTSSNGLPITVQIICTASNDMTALAVAKQLEVIHGGWKPPASFWHHDPL